jgi:hypothetical protein
MRDQGGGSGGRAWCGLSRESLREAKARFGDGHHRTNDRIVELSMQGNLGRPAMKTLLVGIAFAVGMVFTSQAFALPYCANGSWQHGYYICADFDE